ncbi:MAG: hypothetical protein IPH07_13850 [Deltaproteobacteria bacterium]|nr:hypothetical protein [Deltaproteobacteria bacterium]MBK8241241.1 hypothetical protein [Deltaproteobacteria bacterium]MBP7286941.1 hypothetical protein [Nannocystaceae bacterium]
MHSPYFDDLCADIRGFDLGDDTELRARLETQAVLEPATLVPDAWSLLAVLRQRAGDHHGALAAVESALAAGAQRSVGEFLRAHLLGLLGRNDEATRALTAAAAAAGSDDGIAHADLLHAEGALALARGDGETAVARMRAGLEDDPHDAARWLALGRLLGDRGDLEGAEQAIRRALVEDDELLSARYELATLMLAGDRAADATAALAELIDREPSIAERARMDPRWRRARHAASVTAVLAPMPMPPTWLPEAPAWLMTLARDPQLGGLQVQCLGGPQSQAITRRLLEAYERGPAGTMHTPATLAHARSILARVVPVARGPLLRTRDRVVAPMLWLLDRQRDELLLALSESHPPFLWLPAGRDVAGMRAALADFVPRPFLPRVELPAQVRGFIGYRLQFGVPSPYTGELEPANAAELDRHFALNPFVEPGAWGSCVREDPWPAELPDQPQLQLGLSAREQQVTQQRPGRVWSISRRTRHSRSILTIELHHRDVFVAEVRYRPSRHGAIVAAMNAHFGSEYPTDLPLDVVAALLGFRFESARDLEAQLDGERDPDVISGLLQVLSALRHSDPSVTTLYRRYLEHEDPSVRAMLYNIFVAHNHESLLEEATVSEPDHELRAQIEGVLDDGIAVVQWDPYRDYDLDHDEVDDDALSRQGSA